MFELIIVLALILLNGFFAMSEMSVMTSRKSRLKQMAGSRKRAERAAALLAWQSLKGRENGGPR